MKKQSKLKYLDIFIGLCVVGGLLLGIVIFGKVSEGEKCGAWLVGLFLCASFVVVLLDVRSNERKSK
jgi:hypothetical protein